MKTVRSWYIDGSRPPEGPNKWRKRVQVSVLADNVQQALNTFREAYPDAEVWCVRHEGKRLVLNAGTLCTDDTN